LIGRRRKKTEVGSVARKRQLTIGWLMAAIAVCAVALTSLRYPLETVAVYAGPLALSLCDVRRGGSGYIGGLVGGLITFWAMGIILLMGTSLNYGLGALASMTTIRDFVILTVAGAAIGNVVGFVVWLLITAPKASGSRGPSIDSAAADPSLFDLSDSPAVDLGWCVHRLSLAAPR
jgi:hypothetical protein